MYYYLYFLSQKSTTTNQSLIDHFDGVLLRTACVRWMLLGTPFDPLFQGKKTTFR